MVEDTDHDKKYRVGIYCRVGRKDDAVTESAGIAQQKAKLTDFVAQKGWRLVKVYADDGCSGIHFNRPAFQAMLQDIQVGALDCIITCDLARLSRNLSGDLLVLERDFPKHKTRFLTLDGSVDTLKREWLSDLKISEKLSVKASARKAFARESNEGRNPASRRTGHRPER